MALLSPGGAYVGQAVINAMNSNKLSSKTLKLLSMTSGNHLHLYKWQSSIEEEKKISQNPHRLPRPNLSLSGWKNQVLGRSDLSTQLLVKEVELKLQITHSVVH